jgi:hypothetical protein
VSFSRAQFYARFPEFDLTDRSGSSPVANTAQDTLVDATIAGAEAQTDRTLFVSVAQADECVKYLTAHLLARSPAAMNLRLQKSRGDDNLHTGEDVYWPVYARLARAVG